MIILPSGKPKIWDKHPDFGAVYARYAYTGTFHTLCKEYAKSLKEEYIILSPKYGFLKPDTLVPQTYDVRFTQSGTNKDTISLESLRTQWIALSLPASEPIVVLGGQKFKPLMETISESSSHTFHYPLHGLGGIGYMQQKLKHAIKRGVSLD